MEEEPPLKKSKHLSMEKSENVMEEDNAEDNETEEASSSTISFDPEAMRKRLRGDTGIQAIKIFLNASSDPNADAVKAYIKAGGGPLELLQVINNAQMKNNPMYAFPVFSAVQLVVMKMISDFPLLHKSAEESCCYLLREYIPTIQLMIAPSASVNHKIAVLKLLTSVVTLSTQLARDVLNSINLEFSRVEHLAVQVTPHDRKSVRVTFIHFILSFIIEGNSYIIRQLLQNKGLLRLVMQDLIFDNSTTVTFLLTALRDKVVSSVLIPKSLKINCFNTAVLILLLDLYDWLGPKHWSSKKSLTEDRANIIFKGDEDERTAVQEAVHSLLLMLCTNHKLGVVFFDKNVGLGQRQNEVVRSFLKGLEKHWDNKFVKELTLATLLANPDLIKSAFITLKQVLQPRPTNNWLSSVDFLIQLVEKLDPKSCLPEILGTEQLIKLMKNLTLAGPILQTVCSEESFKSDNAAVRGAAAKYLVAALKKLQEFISYSNIPTKIVLPSVADHLKKCGPELQWIESAWNMGSETAVEVTPLKSLSRTDYHIQYAQLMTLMCKITPDIFEFTDVWSDNLMSSLTESNKCDTDDPEKYSLFILETLKMVSVLTTLNPDKELFGICIKSVIPLLKTNLEEDATVVLEKLILSTGFLEGVEDEVEIWLHCLTLDDSDNSVIVEFFQDIIKEAATNIATHFKTIVESCNEVASYLGKPSSTIDELISMLEEEDDEEDSDLNVTVKKKSPVVQTQQIISPLLTAMLKIISNKNWLKKDGYNEDVINVKQNFVTGVLVHSLHRQVYPQRLQWLIEKSLVGKATAAYSYIKSWTEFDGCPHSLTFEPFHLNSVESKLSKMFLNQGKKNNITNEVLELLENSTETNHKLHLHLCVFYLTQLYQRNYLTSDIIEKSVKIISKILNLLDHSSQVFVKMLQDILVHPSIVDMFVPIKRDSEFASTEVVLLFVNAVNRSIKDKHVLEDTLFTCRRKLVRRIFKMLEKKEAFKILNFPLIIQEISLSEDDVQNILSLSVSLPSNVQEDGWIEVEASLLKQAAENSIILSNEVLSKLSKQMTRINGGPICLQQSLISYLKRFPHYIEHIDRDLFVALLNANIEVVEESNLDLAKLLLSSDERLVPVFENHLVQDPSLLFPLLSVIKSSKIDEAAMKKIISKQVKNILVGVINKDEWFLQHSEFIASLVDKYMYKKLRKKLYTVLKSQWADVPQDLSVLYLLKSLIGLNLEVIHLIGDVFEWVLQSFNNSSVEGYHWLYDGITNIINSGSKETNWSQLLEHNYCSNVMRLSLKWGLRQNEPSSLSLMKMLVVLCGALFSVNDKCQKEVSEFFNLIVSHSDFIFVILEGSEITYQTVQLLLVLLKVNPKLAVSSHVPIYLSAYGATLGKLDQTILELLQLYETSGVSVWEWRPCLWGPTAANYYSVHSKSAQPLWRQPRMSQVLDLLDINSVDATVSKFPLKRSLEAKIHVNVEDGEKVYDIAFILPLLTHLLAPGADVQHRRMVDSGALAITIASLSSGHSDVRSVAYLVLTRFHSHLSTGDNDQQLWLNFINAIRGGVLELGQENPQLATVVTTFLARASIPLSFPQHPMFSALHNFVLAKPVLQLHSVPAFLELLQSKDVQYKDHQEWILNVLKDGTRQEMDMKLLFQKLVFKILMALYSYVHTSKDLRILIIEFFSSCVAVPDVGYILVEDYGLMSWVSHSLSNKKFEEISSLILLLERAANFKSHSLQIKLILIMLASNVTAINDVTNILNILGSGKLIQHLNEEDIRVLINMVSHSLGSEKVEKSNDMLKYGCQFVTNINDTNLTVDTLNKLVYNWIKK